MTTYRRYQASFPFDARDDSELTIRTGDMLIVGQTVAGGWPDAERWMRARNERSGMEGDFPGTYAEFVEEITIPLEPEPEPEAPPVPRRVESASAFQQPQPPQPVPRPRVKRPSTASMGGELHETTPPPQPSAPSHPQLAPPSAEDEHDWFKVTFQIPVQCSACDDFIWGSSRVGYKCTVCVATCHTTCKDHIVAAQRCIPMNDDSILSQLEYTHTVSSYMEWTGSDIMLWMKAVNIDAYAEFFKTAGIRKGSDLKRIDSHMLHDMGITDELHCQIIMECLDELCRGSSSVMPAEAVERDETDIGANFKRLSGFIPRSPSTMSLQSMLGSLGKKS